MDEEDIAYIIKTKIRFHILIKLKDKNKTPKELCEDKYYITHISSNLKDLTEKGYVICLNPSDRKNKKFTLTKKSKELLKFLNDITK